MRNPMGFWLTVLATFLGVMAGEFVWRVGEVMFK